MATDLKTDLKANLIIRFKTQTEGIKIAKKLKAISKKYNTEINVLFIKI